MATIRWILGIICLVICGGFVEPSGGFLEKVRGERLGVNEAKAKYQAEDKVEYFKLRTSDARLSTFNFKLLTREPKEEDKVEYSKLRTSDSRLSTFNFQLLTRDSNLPTQILQIAKSQIGVSEATGNNDGKEVEAYLRYTGNKKGEPWCASFVSWVFGQAGFKLPKTAWSPALFPVTRLTKQPIAANVFGIYFSNLKRIAHCGLVETVRGNWIGTIEGNTNTTGGREGDGIYRKLRHEKTIAVYANWIKKSKKGGLP